MAWIKRLLLSRYVKGWLDKIPLDGKKTYLSLIVLFIGAIIKVVGQGTPVGDLLQVIYDAIVATDGVVLINDPVILQIVSGMALGVVGVFHKVLKWLQKKEEKKAN